MCGNEFVSEKPQNNISLTVNKDIDNKFKLEWNQYLGLTVSNYRIYSGESPTNLSLIDSTLAITMTYANSERFLVNNYDKSDMSENGISYFWMG